MAAVSSFEFPQAIHSTITSGGLLWRKADDGTIEICLGQGSRGFVIPRGMVLEDERVLDAAIRRVYERTGICGANPRRIGRVTFEDGEIAFLHLLRVPAQNADRAPEGSFWVPLASAPRLMASEQEREVVSRVARAFAVLVRFSEGRRRSRARASVV